MKTNKKILSVVLMLASLNCLFAVRAIPEPVSITQPDGSQITVYLRGDESFHYHTTTDGYLVEQNSAGVFHYATFADNGTKTISSIKANNPLQRTLSETAFVRTLTKNASPNLQNANSNRLRTLAESGSPIQRFPLVGSPKSLVILVNFADKNFVTPNPQTAFTNLLNQQGYNANGGTGSARDYFRDASNNQFSPQFDVVGPYTLPQTLAYYGTNVSGGDSNTKLMEFVRSACNLADSAGVNFAQYDTDNDGKVDNVFIYYAGYNEAEGGASNTIWPHRYNVNFTIDGKRVSDYACTSELRGYLGNNMCGIGTFVHEFGHVLGLPDLYATNDASHATMGSWDVMDYGPYLNNGRTPPTYSSYERFFMGWLTPEELINPQNDTIASLVTSNKAYLISNSNTAHNLNGKNPNPAEFFLLENRQKTGWDTYLPGHGLLVTRIYYQNYRWNNNSVNNTATSMGVQIMAADGVNSSNGDGGDPFPGTASKTSFSPKLRSGTIVNKPLTYIKETGGVITFKFKGGENPSIISAESNITPFEIPFGNPSDIQTFKVSGRNLEANINIAFGVNRHFEMKGENDTVWVKTLTLPVSQNSEVDTTIIQVRYNPYSLSSPAGHKDSIIISSLDAENIIINISGIATHEVVIVPPVAKMAQQVTGYSFVANWEAVPDATGYYLTVFTATDQESTIKENFANGLNLLGGWTTNANATTTSTTYSGDAPPALALRTNGDYLQTDMFNSQATSLSFILKSSTGYNCKLYVNAWNGTEFVKIDSIDIILGLSDTLIYNFTENDNYSAFKLEYSTPTSGNIFIDDVAVTFANTINIIISNKWVEGTSDTITGLSAETDYYYKVKASDKKIRPDSSVVYENITSFSNTIHIKTNEPSAVVPVFADEPNSIVSVYNVLGQLLFQTNGDKFAINQLPKKQMLIVKLGNKTMKIVVN